MYSPQKLILLEWWVKWFIGDLKCEAMLVFLNQKYKGFSETHQQTADSITEIIIVDIAIV